MPIKLIVEHISSKFDANGNRYWLAKLTSTATGESKLITTISDSNTVMSARICGLKWEEMYETTREVPIRMFNAIAKQAEDAYVDSEVTATIQRLLFV